MSDSLTLLALPVTEANRQIAHELLRPNIDPSYIEVGEYIVREDGAVTVPIYSSVQAHQDPEWHYRGEAVVRYGRLDLNETFGHLHLRLRVGVRYTTDELVERLGSILQIHFETGEFVRETRDLTTMWERYLLRAAADSPRWSGEVPILVYR